MYTQNHKTFLKEIKDDLNKWRDIFCSRIGRLNTAKMAVFPNIPKAFYRFNAIPTNIQMAFWAKTGKVIVNFT